MKYIIVGMHSSGKQALARGLETLGVKVGKIFRSTEILRSSVYSLSEVVYTHEDINSIFENQGYIFLKQHICGTTSYFEGLSTFEYDNNDVFIMSPDQFNNVPEFGGDVCFVWLDSNKNARRQRYYGEKRKYSFTEQEERETEHINDFTDRIYQNDVLYFNNEDVNRVCAIIYTLVNHPELYDVYKERFN